MSSPFASICSRVATHAAAAPERLAVGDGEARLTYADLDRRSDQLAIHLRDLGAGPGQCVGLFLDRSVQVVVAALAAMRAGAAYLPLDPSTPADRVAFILTDSSAALLLTDRGKGRGLRSGPWGVVEIDDPGEGQSLKRSAGPVRVEPGPADLAYVIYTSGSAGRPKGVEITHANLSTLIDWHQTAFGVAAVDRAAVVAGLGFDAAVWEIWPHLAAGASLHIADEPTRRSPPALRTWLVDERITISFVPTVLAERMTRESWPTETALRVMLTGGEALRRRPVAGLPFVLVNNYGPTECTVVATSGAVAPGCDDAPSIGRPIAGTVALILDDTMRPVRTGESGELCLAGASVGRGYRNDPELTASRFVTYSPDSGPPIRIYRTGDLVRQNAEGEIAFLGRRDEQLKVRGYRVEPSEIVACLSRCPGVEACAVVPREGAGSDTDGPALIAYVVSARDIRLTATGLRKFLADRLPDYMIPGRFVALDSLPTTSNGKIDRLALPAPAADNLLANELTKATTTSVSTPGSGYQQEVATLMATLLGQPALDPEENFFLMGGHSMLAAQLLSRIKEVFGVRLTLRQLFAAPTVAALSAEVERTARGGR
jgi:amino acid adenylation domain-containing protein